MLIALGILSESIYSELNQQYSSYFFGKPQAYTLFCESHEILYLSKVTAKVVLTSLCSA